MDDDIGPWLAEPVLSYSHHSPVRLHKPRVVISRPRQGRTSKPSAPKSVQVSPVTFRSPEFRHFVPAHTWKPLTPCVSKTKADHFGLFLAKAQRPLSAIAPCFDLDTAKRTILKLSRGSARNSTKEGMAQPASNCLIDDPISRVTRVLDVLRPIPRCFKFRPSLSPPSHSYRRRVKPTDKPGCPDYDQLAENLNEQLISLIRGRPKTSHIKVKTPTHKLDPSEELKITLSRMVANY